MPPCAVSSSPGLTPSAPVESVDFVLEGGESSLRLAYSGVTPAEIEDGVKRLADAYREVQSPAHAA